MNNNVFYRFDSKSTVVKTVSITRKALGTSNGWRAARNDGAVTCCIVTEVLCLPVLVVFTRLYLAGLSIGNLEVRSFRFLSMNIRGVEKEIRPSNIQFPTKFNAFWVCVNNV